VYLGLHKGSLKPLQLLTTVIPATSESKKANYEKATLPFAATRAASDHQFQTSQNSSRSDRVAQLIIMVSWVTLSEREKVSEILWEASNIDGHLLSLW
jgi:hypothetical protein